MVAHINLGIPNPSAIHNQDTFEAVAPGVLMTNGHPPFSRLPIQRVRRPAGTLLLKKIVPALTETGSPVFAHVLFPSLRTDRNNRHASHAATMLANRTRRF